MANRNLEAHARHVQNQLENECGRVFAHVWCVGMVNLFLATAIERAPTDDEVPALLLNLIRPYATK